MTARQHRDRLGLDAVQLAALRDRLEAGGRPRVQLSGSQFPEGSAGTIVRIGDPAVDGTDFVTVRVKLAGVTDELAFAPAELSPVRRAGGEPPASRPAARRARRPSAGTTSPKPAATAAVPGATPPRSKPDAAAQPEPASPGPASGRRRGSATTPVTITITSTGSLWAVTARRGARTVAKSAPATPGVVTAIAALLDQPGISEAVAAVNDTARDQAQARADNLRAELADVEAILAGHRSP